MARRQRPATTVEGREQQMIGYAVDLAEKQLLDGSAPPSVITHYLKLGSTRERLEKERLIQENELLKAKTQSIYSGQDVKEIVENALAAMRRYAGYQEETDENIF